MTFVTTLTRGAARAAHAGNTVPGVHYTVTGDGPHTVVLLHGFTDNLTTWGRVVPRLAVEHRVIAIDLPGFGRSTARPETPLLDGYVNVVARVLDAEGITDPVSLMGNSMGAAVSSLFAAKYPARTDRIVLLDMPGWDNVPWLWTIALSRPAEFGLRTALHAVPSRAAQFGLGWAYSHIMATNPRRIDPMSRLGFTTPYARRGSIPDVLPIGRAMVAELRTARLAEIVDTTVVPVLVVFGSRDLLTPPRVIKRMNRRGAIGRAVVIPGCGHCPQIDQPEALLDQVTPFLRAAAPADLALAS